MTPEEMQSIFSMKKHEENGSYIEMHYETEENRRPDSGSVLYYVSPNEKTKFHSIDCDEYWCYTNGSPLELWMFDEKGDLEIKTLGKENGCIPFVYVKQGTVFASKHKISFDEGTFLVCITVPRFSYTGFRLYEKSEMIRLFPEAEKFFKD